MPWRRLGLLMTIPLLLAAPAAAGIRLSFYWDSCAYFATQIIVAAQEPGPEAKLVVLETWKGSLTPGTQFTLADLPPAPMDVEEFWDQGGASPHTTITGKRIVLFLKQGEKKAADQWVGANSGEALVSAVWIEQGEGFVYEQFFNPGPRQLTDSSQSEVVLKRKVQDVLAAKEDFKKILANEDPSQRARLLIPLVQRDQRSLERDVYPALERCGKPALPFLRDLVGDARVDPDKLVHAIAATAGADAGVEITAIVRKELTYWQEISPTLKPGWRHDPNLPRFYEHSRREDTLLASLAWLDGSHYAPARGLVSQIRDFWASLPQLRESVAAPERVINACDKYLGAAPNPASP